MDAPALQSLAGMPELGHYGYRGYGGHGRRRRKNVCLITANHSLNGVSILNILNNFGGW
ncbi:MAG: hypothetical protein AB1679_28065 [Actinomycetota bacterium]